MQWLDALGQELELDSRIAHYSTAKMKNGNAILKGTVVGFTQKLVQVRIDGEEHPKNLNAWKLVLIKDQTPEVTFALRLDS